MVARRSPQTERVIGLINMLTVDSRGEGVTLSELARRLQLSKATCYPMLEALTDAGFLTRHPTRKTFHLGPALIAAGQAASRRNALLESARDVMVAVGEELNLTCWLFGVEGATIRVLDQAWHSRRLTPYMRVGDQYRFDPPSGAVIAAHSTPSVVDAWLGRGVPAAQRAGYRQRLGLIRDTGWAAMIETLPVDLVKGLSDRLGSSTTLEERQRMVTLFSACFTGQAETLLVSPRARQQYFLRFIDAPVFDASGEPAMAISLTNLPTLRGSEIAELGERLRAASLHISRS